MSRKKNIWITAVAAAGLVILQGCYKVATVPRSEKTDEVTKTVSFAADIQPLLATHCSISGCHSAGATAPDLSAEKAYQVLYNGGYIDINAPENSSLYLWITGKKNTPMPPGTPDPGGLNGLVLAWIKQGAINN